MGVFDLTDATDLPCDCGCPGHSLRRELEHKLQELERENKLLKVAVRELTTGVRIS